MIAPLASLAVALSCNTAPANQCNPKTNAAVGAGQPPATCAGTCESVSSFIPDASTIAEVCTLDCTSGSDVCASIPGTSCVSFTMDDAQALSFCLVPCSPLSSCPLGLSCVENTSLSISSSGGVCL